MQKFIVFAVPILFLVFALPSIHLLYAQDLPNILLITLDTTRSDRLPCYGYNQRTMPFLCGMAQNKGHIFENAYTTSPLTLPAHASLLTGLTPEKHALFDNGLYTLSNDIPTIASLLKTNGYSCYAYVSAAVLDRIYGLDQGFEVYDDDVRMGKRAYFNYKERAASQVVDRILTVMDGWKKPWLVWVHFYDPHDPYVPPPPYDQQFKEPYDGELAFVDGQLQRLWTALEKGNRWQADRDWAFIVGDHGEDLGEFGEMTHGILLTPATLRIPLIVMGPDTKPKRYTHQVFITDIGPSILTVTNLWPGRTGLNMDGQPLWIEQRQPLFMVTFMPFFSFRWSPLLGVLDYPWLLVRGSRTQLFNLQKDPKMLDPLQATGQAPFEDYVQLLKRSEEQILQLYHPEKVNLQKLEQLRTLGYIATIPDTKVETPFSNPDPRDKVQIYKQFLEGKQLIKNKDWQTALDTLSKLLTKDPDNTLILNNIASVYEQFGRKKEAEQALQKVVRLIPTMDYPYLQLAQFYVRHQAWDKAEQFFLQALRRNKRNAEIYLGRFIVALRSSEFERALQILDEADRLGIEDPDIHYYRASYFRTKGNWQEAFQAINRAVELNPGEIRILIEQCKILCHGRSPYGQQCSQFFRTLDPKFWRFPEFWSVAAEWFAARNKLGQSLYCWQEAARRQISDPKLSHTIQREITRLQSQGVSPLAPTWDWSSGND